jgi:multicomponent Na+:H+ antiporter subunit B
MSDPDPRPDDGPDDTTAGTVPADADTGDPGPEGERTAGQLTRPAAERSPYVESTIIMTTVRVIAPFVLTLGAFVMFHGASSAGGGFQGGVIAATTVIMLGFAFGIDPIATHLRNGHIAALVLGGLGAFLVVGFGGYLVGDNFLQISGYEALFHDGSKYSIELVEVGIGVIVAGVVTGLFFMLGDEVDAAVSTDADDGGEP